MEELIAIKSGNEDTSFVEVLESDDASPKVLKVALIQQGTSKNKFIWTKDTLNKVQELSEGVPVQATDFSKSKLQSFFDHWSRVKDIFPADMRDSIPELFPKNIVGYVKDVIWEGEKLVGKLHLTEDSKWLGNLVKSGLGVGAKLFGLSINAEKCAVEKTAEGTYVNDVGNVISYDIVEHPSAGGGFQAVLESLSKESVGVRINFKDFKKALSSNPKMKTLITEIPEDARGDDFSTEYLQANHPVLYGMYVGELANGALPKSEEKEEKTEAKAEEKKAEKAETKKEEKVEAKSEEKETTKVKTPNPEDKVAGKIEPKAAAATPEKKVEKVAASEESKENEEVKTLKEQMKALQLRDSAKTLKINLSESKLPESIQALIHKQYDGVVFEEDALVGTIREYKDAMASANVSESVGVSGNGGQITGGDQTLNATQAVDAMDAMLDGLPRHPESGVEAFMGIKEAYQYITGDHRMQPHKHFAQKGGIFSNHGVLESMDWSENPFFQQFKAQTGRVSEAVTTAAFPLILSDRMNKKMHREFANSNLDDWRKISRVESVSDFKKNRVQKFGEYPDLPVVGERGSYDPLTSPSEEEVTFQIEKHGGTESVTWESIKNDETRRFRTIPGKMATAAARNETRRFRTIPGKMATAAARTLYKAVFDLLQQNSNIYDGTALATAGHGNEQTTAALAEDKLWIARRQMAQQKDLDNRFQLQIEPRWLLVATNLYETAVQLTAPAGRPINGLATNSASPIHDVNMNNRYGITPLEIKYWEDDGTNNDRWWVVADPAAGGGITVAFLDNQQTPELFIQDMQNVGAWFDREELIHKVRYPYDVFVEDFRPFQMGEA